MREAHPTERAVGMAYYASDADGIGGRLRATPEDFCVREIEDVGVEPLNADPHVFDHLVVRATLRNWDTNAFARALSDRLGISRERVSWAGTKDKRAVTTQLVSIRGVDPGDLPAIENADVEPVGRLGRSLRFGDLVGNDFEIVVTDPDRPGNVTAITDELRAFGGGTTAVPNYFGQQRFGSRRPITHEVGLAIVRGDWKDAVMAYVGNPSEAEPPDAREARQFVEETEDWAAGLEWMPDHLHHERAMLHRLVESESDTEDEDAFQAALETVPTNLQRLFVHAAQSYVFNRILSERFRRELPFDRAIAGDVVCFADEIDGLVVPDPGRSQRVTDRDVDAVNRHTQRGRAFVTAPLVGTETDLGEGDPGAIERAVLDDVGVTPDDFDLPGEFGSTGTRRPVLLRTEFEIDSDPLRFAFALPKGSYATVALREYLKTPPEAME